MPKLRSYSDGRGYYITGYIPEIGFCTWQIGEEGLAYLAARGISSNGDAVRLDDLREMIDRGLVRTAGGGPTPTPAAPPPQWVKPLANLLIAWSLNGGVDALSGIVCPGTGAATDSRPRCYPATFLTWIDGLDPDSGLVRFAGISAAEFEALTANGSHGLDDDPLFGHLTACGAIGVLWRLSRLVGTVAVRLRTDSECPAEWRTDLMLSWLFGRVKKIEDRWRASPVSMGPRRPVGWKGPRIVWAVELQEVTALLPGQFLPHGVIRVEWRVGGGKPVHTLVRPGPRGRRIEESVSEPLRPSDGYTIELVQSGLPAGQMRWTIGYPTDSPLILFHADGRLVDFEDPDPIPPGRYLALVRPGQEPAARAVPGFELVERIPVGPIGWTGWTGWNAELSPEAIVPGYTVAVSSQAVQWEIESPPDPGVFWLETCPVFIGTLPQINLNPSEAFRGAVVEVAVEGAGGLFGEPIYLTLGNDIPIQESESTAVADLNAVPQLKSRFGRFRLKCQPAGRLDQSPLVLVFTRLPSMTIEYVPDPVRPSTSTAVRIEVNGALTGVTPGPDTEILTEQAGESGPARLVVHSLCPELAPGIYLRSQAADWEMRVRIGVSRAGLVTGQAGFEGWRQLPFEEIQLSRVGLGDRLRMEFHIPPITEGGRLVSRLPCRGELLVGEPLDRSPSPTVFEIPLHRWRDGFGIGSSGVVQIRGGAGWLDTARLTSEPNGPAPAPGSGHLVAKATSELEQAVVRGNEVSADELISRCLEAVDGQECSVCASDLLPLAAARAALVVRLPSEWLPVRSALERLLGREDLPEAKLLAAELDIRGGERLVSASEWSLAKVEAIEARLPKDPGASVVRAECWYRLARSTGGPALGCWQSCMDLAYRYLEASLPKTGLAFSDALLLWNLSPLMLGYAPVAESAPTGILPGHRGWIDAARFAASFVRRPWHGRANPEIHLGLTDKAPSVLCPEDEALIRVVVGIASERSEPERHWPLVAGLPEGSFYALPLLRARYARYAGDPTVGEEYARAWAAFQSGDDADLLDVIAAERP